MKKKVVLNHGVNPELVLVGWKYHTFHKHYFWMKTHFQTFTNVMYENEMEVRFSTKEICWCLNKLKTIKIKIYYLLYVFLKR